MPRLYVQLDLDERRKLYRYREKKLPVDEIASLLGRHRSTIYRELKRNHFHDPQFKQYSGYYPLTANDLCLRRRHVRRKLVRYPGLRAMVIDRLRNSWSPEQIAGRLKTDGVSPFRICTETIYRFAYSQHGRELMLYRYLPEGRRARRRRGSRKPRGSHIPVYCSIHNRPDAIKERSSFGHWECDLMVFRKEYGQSNLTSLVERKSRYTLLMKNNDRQSLPIMEKIITALEPLPAPACQSFTFDRGTEFMGWRHLKNGLGARSYFCEPNSPWQKGTVENTNRRIRRFLPRDTDLMQIDGLHLSRLCRDLNTTPRKCLGYRTPEEVFAQHLQQL